MRGSLVKQSDTMLRINLTPIIDVALVLVIILLITAPMITASTLDVELPGAESRGADDPGRLNITLSSTGELEIEDDRVSPESLVAELRRRLAAADEDVLVIVRADEAVPYPLVAAVLEQTQQAGAKRVAIATRHRGRVRPW